MSDNNQKNDEEFRRLLSRLAEGSLDKADAEVLESLLINQPERQALYLETMWLDASLIELRVGAHGNRFILPGGNCSLDIPGF